MGQLRSGQVKSGQVESGQVKSGLVESGQVKSGQIKLGQVQNFFVTRFFLDPTIFFSQNLFGPKMHLRMEIDSGVGPTCCYFGHISSILSRNLMVQISYPT